MAADRKIADLHAHWFSERILAALDARPAPPRLLVYESGHMDIELAGGPGLPARRLRLNEQWWDLDSRISHLDQHGIEHQLLSWPTALPIDMASDPEDTLPLRRLFNDDLGELVRSYRDRFSGVAALSPSDLEWSARELVRAHEDLGLVGGALPINSVGSEQAAGRLAPVLEVANELGSHIYFDAGWAVNPSQAVVTLAFSEFFDAYPNVSFQVAMLGGPGLTDMVAEQVSIAADRIGGWGLRERFRRIYLDTGAAGGGGQAIGAATRVFGASQILFGTDLGPTESAAAMIAGVEAAPISEDERELIFGGNARRLLGAAEPTNTAVAAEV